MGKNRQIKNNRLTLRFTNDLYDRIAERATKSNLTRTAYLQTLISNSQLAVIPATPSRNLEIYRSYLLLHQELRKQGNNLNQITKAIHAANQNDRMVDPTNCLRVLSSIAKANQEIAAAIAKLEQSL
jgi:hypothetical protein